MEKQETFYKESGVINPIGFSLASSIYLIAAIVIGYFYSALIVFIPLIYVNFFITVGLGILLGFIVRIAVRLSHNRNKKSQIIQALLLGLLLNYFQWVAYILYAYNESIPTFANYLGSLFWIFNPSSFFGSIAEINRVGLWSMFGMTFNGFALTLIWIVEALIIIAGPTVGILTTKVYPFSELLNKWYTKYTLKYDFESVTGSNKQVESLKNDPVQSIKAMGNGTAFRYTKVHVFYLKDEENQYLTFERVFIEGRGKGKKKSTITINNLRINNSAAETILQDFQNKRERWDII